MSARKACALLTVAALLLVGCRTGAAGGGADAGSAADDGAAADGGLLPDDETDAEVATPLPTPGWTRAVLDDPSLGAVGVPLPPGPAIWQVGDDDGLARLAAGAGGSDWWTFWGPRLAPLDPATSNVRFMVASSGGAPGDEPIAIQVNATPDELDVDPQDAAAIAEIFATITQAQGSTVTDTRTVAVDDASVTEITGVSEVAEIAFTVDPEQLERAVWQRFVPVPDAALLWSIQCDGPVGAELEEACRDALAAFVPPAPPPGD